ncbi:MAG TPA: hypothetical protein VMC03_04505 [Streptosporangiaceae bacterium]|nr:hypothetical protein [Streptosporangiaceae bacterium]
MTAYSVRCRCGASLAPPRSTANLSSRWRAISATDMARTRAAASSAASGSPSRRPHSSRTASAGRAASGRAARARCPKSSAVVARSSSGSRYTDSDDRPSGARLVVSTRRSLLSDTRACTRSAAPRATCSQLSSTSRAGPGPRAETIPAGPPGAALRRPTVLPADRVGETGLAQAAGAHDRRDPGRAQQASHGGDVVGPAEQRVGFVPDTAADHGSVGLQQFLVQALQGGARVGAEHFSLSAALSRTAEASIWSSRSERRYPPGVLTMTPGPSRARARDTRTCRALPGCSGCPSGHSASTSPEVLHPARGASAKSASRSCSREPVISKLP